ncbi:MAG: polysaccharide deacetylase family protein [Planctomycetales bacterium]|nr:polysaccharide deacetylase family protein [Planctomycetales bacterium]
MSGHAASRRDFLAGAAGVSLAATLGARTAAANDEQVAQIAITFDLEMSRHYPQRGMTEWDYQKGNLNEETKRYSLEAAKRVRDRGGLIHFFCVGRVLEQENVDWLREIAEMGHPIGNHTYDHVNVWASEPDKVQFRFARSPWLVAGQSVEQIIRENIRITSAALQSRVKVKAAGFRTPGGSRTALNGREDLQRLLLDLGFSWVSSGYPPHQSSPPETPPTDEIFASIVDALPSAQPYRYPTGLVEVPMSPISDVGAFRTSRWKRADFLKSIRQCIQWCVSHHGVFDFLCHPSIMYVEDPGFEVVDHICDLVAADKDRAKLTTLDGIAARVSSGQ